MSGEAERKLQSHRNHRHVYSLQAGTVAVVEAEMLYSLAVDPLDT